LECLEVKLGTFQVERMIIQTHTIPKLTKKSRKFSMNLTKELKLCLEIKRLIFETFPRICIGTIISMLMKWTKSSKEKQFRKKKLEIGKETLTQLNFNKCLKFLFKSKEKNSFKSLIKL